LLETSRKFVEAEEKRKGIQYQISPDAAHYVVLVYPRADKIDDATVAGLESFNKSFFGQRDLKTSNLLLHDQYAITFVSEFNNTSAARAYFQSFTEHQPGLTRLRNHKFDNFVITKENFDIFYRTKGLNEYL